jgi:hypothetical protein
VRDQQLGWVHQAYIKGSSLDNDDHFGNAVDLSDDGSTLVVGADYDDSAYVFRRTNGVWAEEGHLVALNAGQDSFGVAVAVSGDGMTVAVGAHREDGMTEGIKQGIDQSDDGDPGGPGANRGAAYVFAYDPMDPMQPWKQQAYIKVAPLTRYFGFSLALNPDGNTLAVGARNGDGDAGPGWVYVFRRINGLWQPPEPRFTSDNHNPGDDFAQSLALSSDGLTIAVGAPREDSVGTGIDNLPLDNSSNSAGAAYVFVYDEQDPMQPWKQQAYLKPSNTSDNCPVLGYQSPHCDKFGYSIALSADGSKLIVGAPQEDGEGLGVNPPSGEAATDAGAAYVFSRDLLGQWSELAYLKASDTGAGDVFGFSVAVSGAGDMFVVGAPYEDGIQSGAGAVYTY